MENEQSSAKQSLGFALGAQYVKDLSFENKLSLGILQSAKQPPQTDIQFHVSKTQVQPEQFEVCLRIVAKLHTDKTTVYLLDLTYAGLFMLKGLDKNILQQVLMIECPRLLYPSVRALVVTLTQESGFPPMYLAPAVDFASLYQQEKKKDKVH